MSKEEDICKQLTKFFSTRSQAQEMDYSLGKETFWPWRYILKQTMQVLLQTENLH